MMQFCCVLFCAFKLLAAPVHGELSIFTGHSLEVGKVNHVINHNILKRSHGVFDMSSSPYRISADLWSSLLSSSIHDAQRAAPNHAACGGLRSEASHIAINT